MQNNPLQLIPTLLLTSGEDADCVGKTFLQEMGRRCGGDVRGVLQASLSEVTELQSYTCGPQPLPIANILRELSVQKAEFVFIPTGQRMNLPLEWLFYVIAPGLCAKRRLLSIKK